MSTVRDRVTQQFSSLFVTLVSVLIGLVFADLVAEAHARMTLWPLTLETGFTWAQILGTVFSAITVWVIYSHIGISRQTVATLSDTLLAFLTPALMHHDDPHRPRRKLAVVLWRRDLPYLCDHIGRLAEPARPALASFRRLLRPHGFLIILYAGAPAFLVLGWLDQSGQLPPIAKLLAAASTTPLALICCHMFVRDWRKAVAEASAAKPAEIQPA